MVLSGNPCKSADIKNLTEGDRSVNYTTDTNKCDLDLDHGPNSWYKVSGEAGNALAAVDVPAEGACGTKVPLYLKTSHPAPGDGHVTRQVCSATASCKNIKVINCGAFYLYKFTAEFKRKCSPDPWRYCTNGETDKCEEANCPDGQQCFLIDNGHNYQCARTQPSISFQPSQKPSKEEWKTSLLLQSSMQSLPRQRNSPSSSLETIQSLRAPQQTSQSTPQSVNLQQGNSFLVVSSIQLLSQQKRSLSSASQTILPLQTTLQSSQLSPVLQQVFSLSQQSSHTMKSLPQQPTATTALQLTAQSSISVQLSPQPSIEESKPVSLQASSLLLLSSFLIQLTASWQIGQSSQDAHKTLQSTPQSANRRQVSSFSLQSSPTLRSLPQQTASSWALKSTAQPSISFQLSSDPPIKTSKIENMLQQSQSVHPPSQIRDNSGVSPSKAIASSSVPVNGNWSSWSSWPTCNKPCNTGTSTRSRQCNNPLPINGGKPCEGPATNTEPCNSNICSADKINYMIRFPTKVWNVDLANKGSNRYREFVDEIKEKVLDFYTTIGESVINVEVLKLSKGSVIASLNVSYSAIDALQIVQLQDEMAGGRLGDTPAELVNITSNYVPSEPPVILNATSITSTSIALKWSEVTQLNAAPLLGYAIVYKKFNEIFQVDFMKSVLPISREATLDDLQKFTNYTMRVFAFTRFGNGVASRSVSIRTQEGVPSEYPPNTVVHSTSSSTIDVSWEPISQANVHGILLGYEVRFAMDDGCSVNWETKTVNTYTHRVVLRSLRYFSQYKVMVCAKTSMGCGKEYSAVSYTWGNVPTSPPPNVTAQNHTSEQSVFVNWSPVPDGYVNGLLMGYSLKYQRIRTAERAVFETEEHTVTLKPSERSIVLQVQTYSTYRIQVAAFTQKGMGPYSGFVYAETCRCPNVLYTNYWSTSPYLVVNQKDKKLEGIFSAIVAKMVHTACGICPAHGETIIQITENGRGQRAAKKNIFEVLADVDDVPQITFPIYGNKYITRYMRDYAYINLVESPGVAFIVTARPPGTAARNIIRAVSETVPLMVMSACVAFLSGFIIWFLESKKNPGDFPSSFIKGVGEGFWWSFVSMTTVGYGDRVPKSFFGRIFGVVSILTGLVITSVLIGKIASSLTSVTVEKNVMLYGREVGALQHSAEYRLGILKNAKVNTKRQYRSVDEIRTALEENEIQGALLDTYVAAENKETLLDDRVFVKEILDRPFGYGVVLSGAARNVEHTCRDYIDLHISEIFHIIKNMTKTLKATAADAVVEKSTGLFDSSSQMFLVVSASLLCLMGATIIAGLLYHFCVYVPRRNKGKTFNASSKHSAYKESLVKDMREFVETFCSNMSDKICAIKEMQKQNLKEIIIKKKYESSAV